MARITVEDCLTKETNRFALILLAAKRTKQILNGAPVLLENVKNKPVVTALREIAAGKVRFMSDEDLAKKREQERLEREALLASQEASSGLNGNEAGEERSALAEADAVFESEIKMESSDADSSEPESDSSEAGDSSEPESTEDSGEENTAPEQEDA